MNETTDTRERVVRLEERVVHLNKTVESMAEQVNEMHTLLQQAKGARWAILAAASVGGFVAAKLSIFLPWFPTK